MSEPSVALPPELLDMVFDYLHPSNEEWTASWPKAQEVRQPLSACTLVSRSWSSVAQMHLFRDVAYSFQCPAEAPGTRSWPDCNDPQRRWASRPAYSPHSIGLIDRLPLKSLQMLSEFLQSSPAIRSSIHSLRLACYPGVDCGQWPHMRNDVGDTEEIEASFFISLIRSLPRLDRLQLWDIFVVWSPTTHSIPLSISVRDVQIKFVFIAAEGSALCDLLCCFGTVDRLIIHDMRRIKVDRDTFRHAPPFTMALNVRSLALRFALEPPTLLAISRLLTRSPSAQNLRTLALDHTCLDAIPEIKAIVRDIGPYLERFQLVLALPSTWSLLVLERH